MDSNKCEECSKTFRTKRGLKDHTKAAHVQEKSFAEMAIDAELALAMGEPTDDDWLLP